MEQTIRCPQGTPLLTLRCPIRIDGEIYKSAKGAPSIGQDTANISAEFELI
jgi:crotonobetainyl-CoA:carnitine CoA-transferase CaiB-like acyl-CoA transferase